MYHLTAPLDEIADTIRQKAALLTSKENAADYASAIMDLGAVVCTPKNPQCLLCPWQEYCRSRTASDLEQIPVRRRLEKKEKQGIVLVTENGRGELFIRKRTEKGLLSGLYEFPWNDKCLIGEGVVDTGLSVTHILPILS